MKMPTLKQLLHKRIIYGNDYSEIKILEFTDDYTFIKLQYETGIKEWKKIIPQDDCYVRLREFNIFAVHRVLKSNKKGVKS